MNSIWRYWGKARPVEGSKAQFHLLPLHCLDVAAVAACWWDSTASMRRTFVHALGVPEEPARAWVLFFVALHDLGKLDVRFQLKAPEVLRELQPDVNHEDVEHESRFDHGAAGLKWAAKEYHDWLDCPDDIEAPAGWRELHRDLVEQRADVRARGGQLRRVFVR